MANPSYFYTNSVIATIPASGGAIEAVSTAFDEDPSLIAWKGTDLWFLLRIRKRAQYLFRLDTSTKRVTKIAPADGRVGSGVQRDGDRRSRGVHRRGPDGSSPRSIRRRRARPPKKLTNLGGADRRVAAAGARSDLLEESGRRDDRRRAAQARRLPAGRRYPLLVVIHGGPTGVSRPIPFASTSIYPIDVWLAQGVARPRAELSRQRRLRREVPRAQRAQSRRRRRVGRAVRHRWLVAQGLVDATRRRDGLEPGRLHLRVPHDARQRAVQGDLGGRGHLRLDDVLREHRHHAVHAAVPQGHAVGRSRRSTRRRRR